MPQGRVPEQNRYPYTKSLFMYLRGEEVRRMKEWLNELNDVYKFSFKKLEETDYFGFDAIHFIREFQTYCGLAPTGTYDLATHTALEWKFYEWKAAFANMQKNPPKPTPDPFATRKW